MCCQPADGEHNTAGLPTPRPANATTAQLTQQAALVARPLLGGPDTQVGTTQPSDRESAI